MERLKRGNCFIRTASLFALVVRDLKRLHLYGRVAALCLFALPLTPASGAPQLPPYPPQAGYSFVDAFPTLQLTQPVSLRSPPGETNRLFIVERTGRILVIMNLAQPTISTFLDLTANTDSSTWETGLLGLAFHPGFATNGQFFIYRTAQLPGPEPRFGAYDIVSRFKVSAGDPNKAAQDSEVRILNQLDGETFHNAGDLAFGPDGYLYISLGYNGPVGDDISTNKQAIDKGHFGGILRIDVDKRPGNLPPNPHPSVTPNYLIPNDNPFIGITSYQGIPVDPTKVRTEYFAIGFRNPWRIAINPQTGIVVAGEVGNGLKEEIDLVKKGANYGWPYYEADLTTPDILTAPTGLVTEQPVISYWHGNNTNEGNCVIGGVFYLGSKIPQLTGSYLFGDWRRGHVWALQSDGHSLDTNMVRLTASPDLTSFGIDPRDGEVLITSLSRGKILKLIYTNPSDAPAFPQKLSEIAAFTDLQNLSTAPEFVPYQINHPFWSDNAIKTRWFWPGTSGQKLSFDANGYGILPAGAVWMKHFELEMTKGDASTRRRLETRFLVKTNNGVYGVTYRWDATGKDATLVPEAGADEAFQINDGGVTRTQIWHYPSQAECRTCHSDAVGQALGFNIAQLNRTVHSGDKDVNQLDAFLRAGYIELPATNYAAMPAMAALDDESQPLTLRAKSFLAANCSFCHYGPNVNATWDGRFSTPVSKMNLGGLLDSSNVSGILSRLQDIGASRMPPLARSVVDRDAVELLQRWINAAPVSPWSATDVGAPSVEGYSSIENSVITLTGAGSPPGSELTDSGQFLSIVGSNNIAVRAHVLKQTNATGQAGAGLMIRSTTNSGAPFVFAGKANSGQTVTSARSITGSRISGNQVDSPGNWVSLVKQGLSIRSFVSESGDNWQIADQSQVDLTDTYLVGLFSYSSDGAPANTATIDSVSMISASLASPADGDRFVAGAPISLNANCSAFGTSLARIDYYANGAYIGQSTSVGDRIDWRGAVAGQYQILARAIDSSGLFIDSKPNTITVSVPNANAALNANVQGPLGSWYTRTAPITYAIPRLVTNIAAGVQLDLPTTTAYRFNIFGSDPRTVRSPDGTSSIASAWRGNSIQFTVTTLDGAPRQLDLYFVDWDGENVSQRISVIDDQTGATVVSQSINSFEAGAKLGFRIRGAVRVVITPLTGSTATLSAIIVRPDQSARPVITMSAPVDGLDVTAGDPLTIETPVQVTDGDPIVTYFANGSVIGEVNKPPYRFVWAPGVGTFEIFARVTDSFGLSSDSTTSTITAEIPSTSATFLGADDATQGNWVGVYGTSGYRIVGNQTNLPPSVSIDSGGAFETVRVVMDAADDSRALLAPDNQRAVGYVYNWDTITNRVTFNDGKAHRLSIYFIDWDESNWESTIRVRDLNGTVLDERILSSFNGGRYLTWSIKGDVIVEIEKIIGIPILSGFFIDDPPPSGNSIDLVAPTSKQSFALGADVLLSVTGHTNSAPARQVDFFASGRHLATVSNPPYALRWSAAPLGDSTIKARLTSVDGSTVDSAAVTIHVAIGTNAAGARFIGIDEDTAGDWRNLYGSAGNWIARHSFLPPPNVTLNFTNTTDYVWDWDPSDPRALQLIYGPTRLASTVFSTDSFDVSISSIDNEWRAVSFYCVDWDLQDRSQLIQVLDPADGNVLMQQQLDHYDSGKYVNCAIRGNVIVRFQSIHSHALLSGIFFDALPKTEVWRLDHFASLGPDGWTMSADDKDPDGDSIPNVLEYQLGLDPLQPNSLFLGTALVDGAVCVSMPVNPNATEIAVSFEISTDLNTWSSAQDVITPHDRVPGQYFDIMRWEIQAQPETQVFVRLKGGNVVGNVVSH